MDATGCAVDLLKEGSDRRGQNRRFDNYDSQSARGVAAMQAIKEAKNEIGEDEGV